MVSRETKVHVIAVVLGIGALVVVSVTGIAGSFLGRVLATALMYGLMFAGGHLYFALRGEGGTVPVRSRWRFVALAGAAIVLVSIATGAGNVTVGTVQIRTLAGWGFLGVLVAYFVVEGIAGYRESVGTDSPRST